MAGRHLEPTKIDLRPNREISMNILKLRNTLLTDFSGYYALNDPGHRMMHFDDVYTTAVEICRRVEVEPNHELLIMAAFFHDMFAFSRVNHHILSATWVATTDYPLVAALSAEDRELLRTACLEHRASYKGEFSNSFSELVNGADRGIPVGPALLLARAVAFRDGDYSNTEKVRQDALAHIREKFGTNGYARYPEVYVRAFREELEEQKIAVDNFSLTGE